MRGGDGTPLPMAYGAVWRDCLSLTILGAFQWQLCEDPMNIWVVFIPFLVSVLWLYTAVCPIFRHVATTPYDLFVLYGTLFSAAVLPSCGILYDQIFLGVPPPTNFTFLALIADLVCAVLELPGRCLLGFQILRWISIKLCVA